MAIDPSLLIAISAVAVTAIVIAILIFAYICCMRYRNKSYSHSGYTRVEHSLDKEEMRFKENIEAAGSNTHNKILDDNELDANDLDRLDLLEKYRSNLIAGVNANITDKAPELRL